MSAGVVEREELAVDVEHGNLFALHLDQTRLTRLDLSCPRWPGDQHCEITFVPIIPVSFGENERAAANSESRQGCSSRWSADRKRIFSLARMSVLPDAAEAGGVD
ncbi:MAG: hypothetical protein QOJ58_5475 [Alphaproteobacteria bacterium]|nr:hypothetical protein [Alphaproteobacteria bacterium]